MPSIYPGFGWDNLTRQPAGASTIPRRGGKFLWEQFYRLAKMGGKSAYIAMFDEVDEGTAIFKVTSQPPTQAHFLGYEGLPSDWYLRLTGEGIQMLRGSVRFRLTCRTSPPTPLLAAQRARRGERLFHAGRETNRLLAKLSAITRFCARRRADREACRTKKENDNMKKVREAGKAAVGGGRSAQSGAGVYYHLTQEEYDQMLADPACHTALFEAEAVEILEKKRVEPDLVYKIREDVIRQAGLGYWIDM